MDCQECKTDLTDFFEQYRDWKYVGEIVKCPICGKQYEVCGDEGYVDGQCYETFWFEPIN